MTSRTPLRNDDVQRTQDAQRPVNESIRDLVVTLDSMPRRQQAWLRFTAEETGGISNLIGQLIRGPGYAVGAAVVLAAKFADSSASALSAAPWLSVEVVDGETGMMRITDAYGLPVEGTFDVLVEFVENMTPEWTRSDVTEGRP